MKSKKFIIGLLSFSLVFVSLLISNGISYSPKLQANGDESLGFEIGDYFEFVCTEFDTTELFNVFGADWSANLGSFLWWTSYNPPGALGEKTRFSIVNITLPSTIWKFTMDGWDWITKTTPFTTTIVDDVIYSLPQNASSTTFNPSVWLLALPVEDYISSMTLLAGYSSSGNEIYYNSTDVQDYQLGWVYDIKTAVVKNFWIKDGTGTTIFEMWGFELKIQESETYNWIVTELNAVELENVYGSNWDSDLEAYCWWALNSPDAVGNKSKFEIDTIVPHPTYDDWYRLNVDGWNWAGMDSLHGGVPDRDDVSYNLPMDPEGLFFHYSLFLIPTPVVTYLEELSFLAGYSASDNTVTRSDTDLEDYEVKWFYNEDLGVTELFQIKNSADVVIFEVILLKFHIPDGTEFTWEVTKLSEAGLEGALGTDWETNLQGYFGTDCNQIGAKLKRNISNVRLVGTLWYVDYSEWYWTTSTFNSNPNFTSSYSLFCDPQAGTWGSWMWLTPFPPHYYLVGRSYIASNELSDLTVTRNLTDIQDFQITYEYDEILGVFNTVQLLDNISTVVFEWSLMTVTVSTSGGIPGYSPYIFISTMILLIGFVSILSIKRIKGNRKNL